MMNMIVISLNIVRHVRSLADSLKRLKVRFRLEADILKYQVGG
jgi:hypothetical protein